MTAIIAPKGTKDTLPAQVHKWHYVEKKFAEICDKYGFKEVRTPLFEHTELVRRGVGDTTDIVQKEMYTFNDYAGRSITLKPEGTSPVTRAFIEHKQYAEVQPTKYYYITPCFRYEKMQKGRYSTHMTAKMPIVAVAMAGSSEAYITSGRPAF